MMRKYNKPEIVALALDMVDVIETSAQVLYSAAQELANTYQVSAEKIHSIPTQVTKMNEYWQW